MKRADVIAFHTEMSAKALELMKLKNEDYATDDNPFANFSRVYSMGICDTFEGFLVRLVDKVSRLSTYSKRGSFSVGDEGLLDTCLDIINYVVLLSAWTESDQADREKEDKDYARRHRNS